MKNIFKIMVIAIVTMLLNSCEDAIYVPLNKDQPRLVIDASINWQKGTPGNSQVIKLSTTTDYYSNVIPAVSGATVFINNSAGDTFNFLETPNTGIYRCDNFVPVIDEAYKLTVRYNGQSYIAEETLKPVAPISNVTQELQSGIDKDFLKLKAFFTDPAGIDNYYLYKYKFSKNVKPEYGIDDDRFFQGNTFFSLVLEEDTAPGQQVEITHYGISQSYYNYMSILLSVAGNAAGGLFQSPPATVRGNIMNQTSAGNYPFGYFRLCESDVVTYTIH